MGEKQTVDQYSETFKAVWKDKEVSVKVIGRRTSGGGGIGTGGWWIFWFVKDAY